MAARTRHLVITRCLVIKMTVIKMPVIKTTVGAVGAGRGCDRHRARAFEGLGLQ